MKDLITVAEFTIKEAIKRKSFIISMLIILAIIILGFNIPNIVNIFSNDEDEKTKVLIIDSENILGETQIRIDNTNTNYDYTITKENLSENQRKDRK